VHDLFLLYEKIPGKQLLAKLAVLVAYHNILILEIQALSQKKPKSKPKKN